MMYPLVADFAGEGIPVTVSCRVPGASTTAFHDWRKSPVSQRDWDDAHLVNAGMDVHGHDPEFGDRPITEELIHAMGSRVGENRVARLCPLQGIYSTIIKRRGSEKEAGPAVHDDCVMCDATAEALNMKWLVDITEHWTLEGKIYLCAIKDCASKRIVGYAIDSWMTSELAVNALRVAIMLRGRPAGTIVHSDRGGQFRSNKFAMTLRNNGLVGSMGRVTSAGDNTAMESFFALLQKKRPQLQAVGHARKTTPRHRHLDRTNLQSQVPAEHTTSLIQIFTTGPFVIPPPRQIRSGAKIKIEKV
jgi:putative transposase